MKTWSLIALAFLAAPAVAGPRTDAHNDPLPDGAIVRFGTYTDRIGGARVLRSLALSPDGKTLAAETSSGITLWDVDTGRPRARIPWRSSQGDFPRFELCYSPDGKQLARLAGRYIQVLDATTGKQLFEHDLYERGKGDSIGFIPDSTRILITSDDGLRVFVFDLATGKLVRTTQFGQKYFYLLAAGRSVLGRADGMWNLLDPETGDERARFEGASKDAEEWFRLAPDGRRAYSLTRTGRFRTFDAESGKKLEELDPPRDWRYRLGTIQLEISRDGAVAYVADGHKLVHRRDWKAGKWLPGISAGTAGRLLPHPDGKRLLIVTADGVLHRYDLTTGKHLPGAEGFEERVIAIPSPDGHRVVVRSGHVSGPDRLDLIDETGKPVWSVRTPPEESGKPHWSPDERRLACGGEGTITLRSVATGQVTQSLRVTDSGHTWPVFFRESGQLVVAIDGGEILSVFDLTTGNRDRVVRANESGLDSISPDGHTLLYRDNKTGLRLFDFVTEKFLTGWIDPPTEYDQSEGMSPRFSPDGSYLVTWEKAPQREPWRPRDLVAVLRDPVTLARQRSFSVDHTDRFEFALSADGLWLATGDQYGKLTLWDVATGKRLGAWEGHRDMITSIGFAGPGRVLTGSADLTALLWDLNPRKPPAKPVWQALSGDDVADAYRAAWAIAADPRGPELLRSRIAAATPPEAAKVNQCIADLGADRFAVRESAAKGLQDFGRLAEPALRAAREKATAEEVRTRLDALLAKLSRDRSPAELVHARAVAALELAGTDAARKLLAEWAGGAPGTRLTIDAKAALARLGPTR
jgi:WD40 repeat protein